MLQPHIHDWGASFLLAEQCFLHSLYFLTTVATTSQAATISEGKNLTDIWYCCNDGMNWETKIEKPTVKPKICKWVVDPFMASMAVWVSDGENGGKAYISRPQTEVSAPQSLNF